MTDTARILIEAYGIAESFAVHWRIKLSRDALQAYIEELETKAKAYDELMSAAQDIDTLT